MNRLSKQMINIFKIGYNNDKHNRILKAATVKDTNPPQVSFLWKTHKNYVDLPPTRPLCNAKSGPIARISELLTMVIDPMIDNTKNINDCDSTEDMIAAVHLANAKIKSNQPDEGDLSIFSMDAEALYPSLDIEDIKESV